jgi:hypothetical protein
MYFGGTIKQGNLLVVGSVSRTSLMGDVRAHYLSHRDRLATRAAQPDCNGMV